MSLFVNSLLMQKEGKTQKARMLNQSSSCVHLFGYKYQKQTNRQSRFSQVVYREILNNEELIATLKAQNQRLEFQLQNIKSLLIKIVQPKQQYPKEITIDQLLEQLFQIILLKCHEISEFKKQNGHLKEEIQNLLKKSSSSISSQLIQSSHRNFLHPFSGISDNRASQIELQYSKVTKKNTKVREQANRCSQQSNKTCSMYRPRVLFQIGKEVNTVNQISSNSLVKRSSEDISFQKKTNSQNSFNQFKKMKQNGNRMSIQGSIYAESQDEVQRINIYSYPNQNELDFANISESLYQRQAKKVQLFQIQEEQNGQSRKQVQLKGLSKIPKRQRLTMQAASLNTFKKPFLNV